MKRVTINLYSFDELNDAAKENAIHRHGSFLDSQPEEYEDEDGEMKEEYVEHSDEDILENIQANEYLFFADGELAHCTTYTGKHEKAGNQEFHFHGKTYDITNL